MKLPLFCGNINGSSLNVGSNYIPTEEDEVEDLHQLLHNIKQTMDFDAICSGAILSDYQRVRVENVCQRLDLVSLAFLWRRDQAELLDEMIESKIESITSSDEEASEVIKVQSNTTKKPKPMLRKKSSMIFICYTLSSFNAKWL